MTWNKYVINFILILIVFSLLLSGFANILPFSNNSTNACAAESQSSPVCNNEINNIYAKTGENDPDNGDPHNLSDPEDDDNNNNTENCETSIRYFQSQQNEVNIGIIVGLIIAIAVMTVVFSITFLRIALFYVTYLQNRKNQMDNKKTAPK